MASITMVPSLSDGPMSLTLFPTFSSFLFSQSRYICREGEGVKKEGTTERKANLLLHEGGLTEGLSLRLSRLGCLFGHSLPQSTLASHAIKPKNAHTHTPEGG